MQRKSISLTEGSVWKGILLFTLPLLTANLFQQFYNAFDSWVVGKFLGETALAAALREHHLVCAASPLADSWKLTDVITSGLIISITKQENANSVGPSYSLFSSIARIIKHCMMQARVMEGENPATAANSTSTGIPRRATR